MTRLARILGVSLLAGVLLLASCGSSDNSGNSGNSSGAHGATGGGVGVVDEVPAGSRPIAHGADPNAPPPVIGGGANSAPLGAGCGPETASECHPVGGNCNPGTLAPDYQLVEADSVCFYAEVAETPAAVAEYVTEVQNGQEYVHLRVTFDPGFVDTVYGECAAQTGWAGEAAAGEAAAGDPKPTPEGEEKPPKKPKKPKGGHTFKDLEGSDHVELMLEDCAGSVAMHLKLDFISEDEASACGYASGGASSGDGKVLVGSPEHVLAASSSLDRNVNGCGYCEIENSPCPGKDYAGDADALEWDYRVVYEVWVAADAFGSAGFCGVDIDAVHASPSKGDDHTVLVEPEDCPPPPCPPNYELYLTSEGEEICVPGDECPPGTMIDLTSEGESCIQVN